MPRRLDGNLRTLLGILRRHRGTDRLCSPSFFLSLFPFIVSSRGELVSHQVAIYSRGVHNCPCWKSHLLTNFVTCPQQFPRISSSFIPPTFLRHASENRALFRCDFPKKLRKSSFRVLINQCKHAWTAIDILSCDWNSREQFLLEFFIGEKV